MGKDRLDGFRKKKETIENQKSMIDEIVNLKQGNIKQEAKTIGVLKKCENNYSYLSSMMGDVSENQVMKMSGEDYLTLTSGIEDPMISGEVLTGICKETNQVKVQYGEHYDMCASLNTVCASGSSGYLAVSDNNPGWFPNRDNIISAYKIEDELFSQIDYITQYLKDNIPGVSGDFEAFIDKYNAFKKDSSQYQDLIGSRSMFFWKMIFDFSMQNYGVEHPRIAAIDVFVFGTAAPVSLAGPIIRSCNNLYDKFSTQDESVPSIKTGNVTPAYIETMFRRLIGNIASLLQLREKYFRG